MTTPLLNMVLWLSHCPPTYTEIVKLIHSFSQSIRGGGTFELIAGLIENPFQASFVKKLEVKLVGS